MLQMDTTAEMAALDEDVVWVEGVKAGRVQASAVMQIRMVEAQVADKYAQLQQDVKVGGEGGPRIGRCSIAPLPAAAEGTPLGCVLRCIMRNC